MCQVSLLNCGHSDYVKINKVEFVEKKRQNTAENSTDLIRVNFKFLEFGHSALCICAKYSWCICSVKMSSKIYQCFSSLSVSNRWECDPCIREYISRVSRLFDELYTLLWQRNKYQSVKSGRVNCNKNKFLYRYHALKYT